MSAIDSHSSYPLVIIEVPDASRVKFTNLLQSGIYLDVKQGSSIKNVLLSLPGFTQEYIHDTIETIFLNGMPVDDSNTMISGESAVLACSAAMPGLAGAIFKKGSIHGALRTAVESDAAVSYPGKRQTWLCIKPFNAIAFERGISILEKGCVLRADNFLKFLNFRQHLKNIIKIVSIDSTLTDTDNLYSLLDQKIDFFQLRIIAQQQ